jgi:hypothetical protein
MELRRNDDEAILRLAQTWKTTPGAEFEAMLTGVDLTSWQDVIQYLRSLGMRESTQILKMNICLSNNIRLTLDSAEAIQSYCKDNRIADKPFKAMLKEAIPGADPVSLDSYAVKAKLKREIPLAADDQRVKDALASWDSVGKHFRSIQRYEFVAPGGVPIRFDISIVRENAGRPARTFQEANITNQPERYEIEVELTANREATEAAAAKRDILRGISWLLQGRQRSFTLISNQKAEEVRDALSGIFALGPRGSEGGRGGRGGRSSNARNRGGPQPAFRFPGPQPATLERKHITEAGEPGAPNVRRGYNVTDKADGLRCLLYVADDGKIYLIDGGGRVYATGKQLDGGDDIRRTVLDGEWIRREKRGKPISLYMSFDILAYKGSRAVADLPFLDPAAAGLTQIKADTTRRGAMLAVDAVLSKHTRQIVGRIPPHHDIQFGTKSFMTAEGEALFRQAAAAVLANAEDAPYNTDGLIFTPNAAPLPIGRGTWADQLKWKPPHENTIDFLVVFEKEQTAMGTATAVDAVGIKYREDTGQTVRFKTMRLFVGSNRDAAFADPRLTVLDSERSLPVSLEEGKWREVEFRPQSPRDPMASICYLEIPEADNTTVRCVRSKDIIQSNMIVEMAYFPERAPGWRWEPVRVRHDKTERWLAQQAAGSRTGGTMNADWVANAIWETMHNPVTLDAITTGSVPECAAPAALEGPAMGMLRRTPRRDLVKVQCFKNFVEDYVKRRLILGRSLAPGVTVCDLGMGAGVDITKYIAANVGFVLGCDLKADALNDPRDGAYRVLLDKMVAMGGRGRVPEMKFVQADVSLPLKTGEAGMTTEDKAILQSEFAPATGHLPAGADVVTCMNTIQYMFSDPNKLLGFLNTLADTIRLDGLFIGYGLDGDTIARDLSVALSRGEKAVIGRDGRTDVWSITRGYDTGIGSSLPLSEEGLGVPVTVDFMAAGESRTEYLVSWQYLQQRLAEIGLEPLIPEEIEALALPAYSQMFSETLAVAESEGKPYEMSEAIRRFAGMHRWWVFRRRADRRPESRPVTAARAPVALTQLAPPTELALAPPPAGGQEAAAAVQIELPEEAPPAAMGEPFLVGAGSGESGVNDDMRLGPEFKDWQRYLTLYAQFEIEDVADPTVKYPSVEAAMAAFKLNSAAPDPAAAKPPVPNYGTKQYRVEGSNHQEYERKRAALRKDGVEDWKQFEKYNYQEAIAIRKSCLSTAFKGYGLLWNKEQWDATKMDMYRAYLKQRFDRDERFRAMLQAIAARGGEILYANGKEPSDIGVGVNVAGEIVGGGNAIGQIMTRLGQTGTA